MVIGMRGHDVGCLPLDDFIGRLSELKVGNIQLALPKAISDIDFSYGHFNHGLAAHIGKKLSDKNIRVSVFGSYIDPTAPDEQVRRNEINKFKENLKYAKYIGADMVGTETGNYNRFPTHEDAYQVLLATVREIIADAEKLGVMVAVEGVSINTLNSVKTIRRLLDEVNSPNLCVIFDPVNLICAENIENHAELIDEMFDLCSYELTAIHLKDFKIIDGKKKVVPIGEGIFDFNRLFKHLKTAKPYINMMIEGSSYETFTKEYNYLKNIYENA